MRRVLLIGLASAALLAAPASANDYVGTVGNAGSAIIVGTYIKCRVGNGLLACAVTKAGKPDVRTWAFTMNDSVVQVGRIIAKAPAYTSPKQPKASGAALSGGVMTVRVKDGQNFGATGTHVACSVLKVSGKTGVACTIVGPNGALPGSYGAVLTSHLIQVRTAEGSKSKVLFSKTF